MVVGMTMGGGLTGRGHLGGQICHSKCVNRKGVMKHSFLTKTVALVNFLWSSQCTTYLIIFDTLKTDRGSLHFFFLTIYSFF